MLFSCNSLKTIEVAFLVSRSVVPKTSVSYLVVDFCCDLEQNFQNLNIIMCRIRVVKAYNLFINIYDVSEMRLLYRFIYSIQIIGLQQSIRSYKKFHLFCKLTNSVWYRALWTFFLVSSQVILIIRLWPLCWKQ